MEMEDKEDYIKAGRLLQKTGAKYVMIPFHCDRLLLMIEVMFTSFLLKTTVSSTGLGQVMPIILYFWIIF
jgi:hypothetical protein